VRAAAFELGVVQVKSSLAQEELTNAGCYQKENGWEEL
jgi:hypothetical protein